MLKNIGTHPEVVDILSKLYADNLSCGAVNTTKAFEIYQLSKEIMLRGGFKLRKWNSNDKGLLDHINAIVRELNLFVPVLRIVIEEIQREKIRHNFDISLCIESSLEKLK